MQVLTGFTSLVRWHLSGNLDRRNLQRLGDVEIALHPTRANDPCIDPLDLSLQRAPFSRGRTVVVPRSRVGVTEEGKKLALVQEGVSLQQIVDGLNALGIGPRDLISILQAIKAAGAIQADIEVM